MARKPDLDSLTVPKGESSPPAPAAGGTGKQHAHTLSLRLTAEGYRRLRRFVMTQEEEQARRVTHQDIIETALTEYLDRHGG